MGHMCTTSDSSCIAPSRSILRMRLNRVQAESLLDQKSRTTMIASPLRVQMARSRIVQALALLLVLALYSVQASFYQLPPFDTVHEVTNLISPLAIVPAPAPSDPASAAGNSDSQGRLPYP